MSSKNNISYSLLISCTHLHDCIIFFVFFLLFNIHLFFIDLYIQWHLFNIYSLIYLIFIYLIFICSFIYSFIYVFICLFDGLCNMYLFIYIFMYLFSLFCLRELSSLILYFLEKIYQNGFTSMKMIFLNVIWW